MIKIGQDDNETMFVVGQSGLDLGPNQIALAPLFEVFKFSGHWLDQSSPASRSDTLAVGLAVSNKSNSWLYYRPAFQSFGLSGHVVWPFPSVSTYYVRDQLS